MWPEDRFALEDLAILGPGVALGHSLDLLRVDAAPNTSTTATGIVRLTEFTPLVSRSREIVFGYLATIAVEQQELNTPQPILHITQPRPFGAADVAGNPVARRSPDVLKRLI